MIRRSLAAAIVFIIWLNGVYAQQIIRATDWAGYPPAGLKKAFNTYPDMDSIHLQFRAGQPDHLKLYIKRDSMAKHYWRNAVYDYFYFKSKGDTYLLQKRYEAIFSFLADSSLVNFLRKFQKGETFKVALFRDSVGIRRPVIWSMVTAEIRRDKREELIAGLKKSYNRKYSPPGDSVLIIQTIVERDGELGDMGLIAGEHSPFYDFVKSCLRSIRGICLPFRDGSGTPRRGVIDIYIRLTPQEDFELSFTGRDRKLVVKDTDGSAKLMFFRY